MQDGGTLTMGLSAEPDVLDPTLSRSLYSRYIFETMCEKLYDVDQNASVVPQLATAMPKTSADGKTVTIPVRTDAVFSDGTKLDSAAVKTTLERGLTNAQSGRTSELGPISSIDTPDPATVVVHFKEPFTPFTAALADRAGMIMSPTALKKYGDDFANHPQLRRAVQVLQAGSAELHRGRPGPELLRRRQGSPRQDRVADPH